MYGTIHVGRPTWHPPGPNVARALSDSRLLALELDPTSPQVMRQVMAAVAPRPGLTLPDPLLKRLAAQLRAACLPEALSTRLTPEIAVIQLAIVAARREGLEAAFGIDVGLAQLARSRSQPIVSLETPESQMTALLSRDADELAASTDKALGDLEHGRVRPMLRRLADAWENGDDAAFSNYAAWCDCASTPRERDALRRMLDDRNPALASGIDRLHAEGGGVFAAVGTLHLTGPAGLPALMQQRGYRVERVAFDPSDAGR